MLNQIILVGRIVEIKEIDNHDEITIGVPRSYRNIGGQYEDDFITCNVSQKMTYNLKEYYEVGSLVGIKGRIARLDKDKEMQVVAEKMTFLSSKAKEEE